MTAPRCCGKFRGCRNRLVTQTRHQRFPRDSLCGRDKNHALPPFPEYTRVYMNTETLVSPITKSYAFLRLRLVTPRDEKLPLHVLQDARVRLPLERNKRRVTRNRRYLATMILHQTVSSLVRDALDGIYDTPHA